MLSPVKTADSERVVPLPKNLLDVLRQHQAAQLGDKERAGANWQEQGMVFTTGLGTLIEPRNLKRHFDRLCRQAGSTTYGARAPRCSTTRA